MPKGVVLYVAVEASCLVAVASRTPDAERLQRGPGAVSDRRADGFREYHRPAALLPDTARKTHQGRVLCLN